jgi:hypothetical protein
VNARVRTKVPGFGVHKGVVSRSVDGGKLLVKFDDGEERTCTVAAVKRMEQPEEEEEQQQEAPQVDRVKREDELGPSAAADDEELCVICLDAAKSHAIVPCGHQCVCEDCGKSLMGKPCPVCREMCAMVMKVWK